MKNFISFASSSLLSLSLLFINDLPSENASSKDYQARDIKIIGGGIIGALESYYSHLDALKNGETIRVTVYEKGQSLAKPALSRDGTCSTNTAYNIVPSLTVDEILSVVPRGSELVEKLAILFSDPNGIRIDDVPGINDSESSILFKEAVALYGNDINHNDRTQTLLNLGKLSMDLWQDLYDNADKELQSILRDSNFSPCHDPKNAEETTLHDGYRIDLLYEVPEAEKKAIAMKDSYDQLGYKNCKILSPNEVITIDPSLSDFCKEHSYLNNNNELKWKDDSVGLWRPGGCIDTHVFLPKFYTYLEKLMGTYTDSSGKIKNRFRLKFNKEVTEVLYDQSPNLHIIGLKFSDGSLKRNKSSFAESEYVFCPGEAIGTLKKFGFQEPAYAGFAGPALFLSIPISPDQLEKYKTFNHCMEVHKVGIVLAWQARVMNEKILIGVGGTKAFYGDQEPHINEAFAENRHLVQLNMINDVLPEMLSFAYGHDTKGKQLTSADLINLENSNVLNRWVGRRGVAYDGFPTLGSLHHEGHKVINARCTTHLGSGGVSFAPAAIYISRNADTATNNPFVKKVLEYADSTRHPKVN